MQQLCSFAIPTTGVLSHDEGTISTVYAWMQVFVPHHRQVEHVFVTHYEQLGNSSLPGILTTTQCIDKCMYKMHNRAEECNGNLYNQSPVV